tara:strand:- start:284 stop:646 length:363 start_codon:yes stop_codon:yes gene_type:complete
MEQTEFLEKNVFTDLKNLNDGFDEASIHYFSESDFETVLERVAHFGIGVYAIKPWFNDAFSTEVTHEEFRRKATDQRWYTKAFLSFKKGQAGLFYSASYKVPTKLLARFTTLESEEDTEA